MKPRKLPSFQFYPGDWLKDPALRACSLAARGAWMDILCLMFECQPRGYLRTNGVPWPLDKIAEVVHCDCKTVLELVANGVMKQDLKTGVFFSKRIVLDECRRAAWRAKNRRNYLKTKENSLAIHSPSTPPSSSSSSSSSSILKIKEKTTTTPHAPTALVSFDLWIAFVEMRKKIRKPLTQHAAELIGKRLDKLVAEGENPVAVLEQSIRNDWQDIYAVRHSDKSADLHQRLNDLMSKHGL